MNNCLYFNLYIETEYTMLGSALKIDELIDKASEFGFKSLAITDLNNMHGVIKFYSKCLSKGIKPVIGLHLTLNSTDKFYNSLLLYAMNNEGYTNLIKIASLSQVEKKGLFIEDIYDYLNNIICIIPNDEHELIKAYRENNQAALNRILDKYKNVSNLYLGIDQNSFDLINFGKSICLKLCALHKTNYLNKDDQEVYRILKSISLNTKSYTLNQNESNAYFLSPDVITKSFSNHSFLIEETSKIVNMCNVNIEFGKYKMPIYEKNLDTQTYLKELSLTGLRKRLIDNNVIKSSYQLYIDRLMYELGIINNMGFNDYFLIVFDFIKFAKKEKILVGPGRGSAPGSLVAYSLGITEIDPIKYNLLFERFLNPERVSMPDIDTDFPDNSRDLVIRYMGRRYSKNRVAHICTFGTFGPRMAIRDIARVTEINPMIIDEILRLVDKQAKSMSDTLKDNPTLKQMADENDEVAYVIKMVSKMENLPRNLSVHAAGIIMADNELIDYTPLSEGINGLYQTQYEASDLEKLGLVKIDFLGLKNLTIIDKVLKNIPNELNFNLNKIPINDIPTYNMLAAGNTYGIFQLESNGMRNTLIQLKTSEFSDIVNSLALYRPGPMDMIPTFVNRKFGKEDIDYLHPDLAEILKPTFGIIVYQEQILLIASKFAGFSLGEADILRRAVSKKNTEILLKSKDMFIKGAMNKGYTEKLANTIFDYILKFADYGFNKSHSVAYSMISYQMAYLKKHFFKEFMTVLLSYNIGQTRLIKSYIIELNNANVEVLPPSINKSKGDFVIENNKIFYSLLGISGFGEVIVNNILEERKINGQYQSYDEFIKRTKDFLPKKNIEALIFAGALDDFNIPRRSMIHEYDKSIELANYGDLFKTELINHIFSDEEYTFEEISNYERAVLGFNLKYNIFRKYVSIKKKYRIIDLAKLKNDMMCNILFTIEKIKVIKTKKGDDMAFLSLLDDTGELEAVLFPQVFKQYELIINTSRVFIGEVKIETRNDSLQGIIRKIINL